ncbi:arginase family protein [Pseudomonadota bacterium]
MVFKQFNQWFNRVFSRDSGYRATTFYPYTEQSRVGAVLFGVASDLSLGRYRGRLSDSDGPENICGMLVKYHKCSPSLPLYEAGIIDDLDGLEFNELQAVQYKKVSGFLAKGHFPVVIGGGHEISISSYQALSDHVNRPEYLVSQVDECSVYKEPLARVGIINFDANFELRPTLSPRVGSVFHSVASFCKQNHRPFHYLGLGICRRTNSQASFEYAEQLGCHWLLDKDMTMRKKKILQKKIDLFLSGVDYVHISFDLSVFSAAVASGVNLSRIQGADWSIVEFALNQIVSSGKVRLLDVAELNPEFDSGHQTAKIAAKVVSTVLDNYSHLNR